MNTKTIFRKITPLLVILTIVLYEIFSSLGAFSGRLGITFALKESESGWIYLEEPFIPGGSSIDGSTDQYTYSVYTQKGATDVVVMDKAHQLVGTIAFADINKGDVWLTYAEAYVYIHLRSGKVAVLNGAEVMDILTAAEANALGIS